MISALIHQPELGFVELFEAGVEPEYVGSRRCLEAVGFGLRSEKPDFEGMLYYRAWRPVLMLVPHFRRDDFDSARAGRRGRRG
jgi:hypothetical protein